MELNKLLVEPTKFRSKHEWDMSTPHAESLDEMTARLCGHEGTPCEEPERKVTYKGGANKGFDSMFDTALTA